MNDFVIIFYYLWFYFYYSCQLHKDILFPQGKVIIDKEYDNVTPSFNKQKALTLDQFMLIYDLVNI